jgi:aspartate carbamoyltransferase catalytic subunit
MPDEIKDYISHHGITQITEYHLLEAISVADVVYSTRMQKERFDVNANVNTKTLSLQYQITPDLMSRAKPNMILMHPLPRNDEISREVDADPRAVYFKQMEYGVYMRMAILDWIICDNLN